MFSENLAQKIVILKTWMISTESDETYHTLIELPYIFCKNLPNFTS